MRAAELAGLDTRQILTEAIGERDLTGARDIAAVIDARIRRRVGTLVPHPARPWAQQLPTGIIDPGRQGYAEQIAALMDARKQQIGEHAAVSGLTWALSSLGPVPDDPVTRLDWQHRAASIGAYRELSGYQHPADPIGPEPAGDPDLRAAWQEALAALGPADGPDARGKADGFLLHLRDTYPVETCWAPRWVGDELRQARAAGRDVRLAALRATAEAATALRRLQHQEATRQQALAASYQVVRDAWQKRETALATTMVDRADWENATCQQRQMAVAADTELRRRHTSQPWPPLRSAEPEPAYQTQREPQASTPAVDLEQLTR